MCSFSLCGSLHQFLLKLIIFFGIFLGGNGDETITDYAKLELNLDELKGSRWAIEKRSKITVLNSIAIVDMVKVDVDTMSIRVDFHLRQRWKAAGIEFPPGLFKDSDGPGTYITADEQVLKSVWSPDSFIPNARQSKIHATTVVESAVNIFKNKTILFKAFMYSVLGCSFTFEWYPLDVQVCDLILQSYRYSSSLVTYEWEKVNPVTTPPEGIILYQYDVKLPPKHVTEGLPETDYPYVRIIFRFERKLGNNIIQIFIPTILITVLSFFSFWLGLDAIPGRISLLITCILTLVTMHSSLKGSIPTVHYVKMMDIWIIGCMCFVFAAICELIVVIYLRRTAEAAKQAKEVEEKYFKELALLQQNIQQGGKGALVPRADRKRQAWQDPYTIPQGYGGPEHQHPAFMQHEMMYGGAQFYPPPVPKKPRPIYSKIDRICRVLFPLLFAAFNGVYWPVLLTGSAKQHPEV